MPLSPNDVFRRPWAWREISRDEASFISTASRVVVVSRPGGPVVEAEWFNPASSYFQSWRPQTRASLRYFLLVEESEVESITAGPGGEPQAGPAEPDQPAEEGEVLTEPPERQRVEEDEPVTLDSNADQVAIAGVLTQAAEQGVPFCEECARRAAA